MLKSLCRRTPHSALPRKSIPVTWTCRESCPIPSNRLQHTRYMSLQYPQLSSLFLVGRTRALRCQLPELSRSTCIRCPQQVDAKGYGRRGSAPLPFHQILTEYDGRNNAGRRGLVSMNRPYIALGRVLKTPQGGTNLDSDKFPASPA